MHGGSVPIVPISEHNFRASSQELRQAQMALHKRPFYNSGNVRVVNSKQDIVCTDEPFEDRHKHVPGYVRQRDILKEVESHKERRLKKLKKLQQRMSHANSKSSLTKDGQDQGKQEVKSKRSVNGASRIIKVS